MAYFPSEQEPGLESLRSHAKIIPYLASFGVLLLSVQLFYLQIIERDKYYALSTKNLIHREKVKARRGKILDRNGKLIAGNRMGYNLYVASGLSKKERLKAITSLGSLGIKWDSRKYKTNRSNLVKRYLGYPLYLELTINSEKYPYIYVEEIPLRDYYYKEIFYHPVGYVSLISPEYLNSKEYANYDDNDYIGKSGLEKKYEGLLKGTDGLRILLKDTYGKKMVLSSGNLGSESLYKKLHAGEKEPKDGKDIILTLDILLQQFIYEEIKDISASVMVMDVNTGELLSYISSPSVDPNIFLQGIATEVWEKIRSDVRHPLLDKGIENFNPASTFKPFTAYCALMEDLTEERSIKPCRGVMRFYNIKKHCWKKRGHGRETLEEAIRDSCNIYFYQLGDLLGINKFKEYADKIHLSRPSGIDLLGEKTPVIPDLEFKFRNKIADGRWYPPETLDVSIGQGFVSLSPVKVLQLYGFFASYGKMLTPHLLKRIGNEEVFFPTVAFEGGQEQIARINKGLEMVTSWSGTGWRARSLKVKISGKTGTMQSKRITEYFKELSPDQNEIPYKERDNPWFASFAPAGSPRYAAVVFMEHQGSGAYLPAILTKKIWERMKEMGYFD